mmetsp:Transcript_9144/g.22712  ORF Transcript_9144/g.22712 Transcript_9144/m.22712 type:complete len:213 (+) Transcript_9144:602-1240(+)
MQAQALCEIQDVAQARWNDLHLRLLSRSQVRKQNFSRLSEVLEHPGIPPFESRKLGKHLCRDWIRQGIRRGKGLRALVLSDLSKGSRSHRCSRRRKRHLSRKQERRGYNETRKGLWRQNKHDASWRSILRHGHRHENSLPLQCPQGSLGCLQARVQKEHDHVVRRKRLPSSRRRLLSDYALGSRHCRAGSQENCPLRHEWLFSAGRTIQTLE